MVNLDPVGLNLTRDEKHGLLTALIIGVGVGVGLGVHKWLWRNNHDNRRLEKHIGSEVIPPSEIDVTFEDIGALDETKESLKEIVMLPITRPDIFNGGVLKPCRGILIFGPPGTGKTMLAKAIAKEAGATFINVTMSTISSMWVGETEKNVRALFKLAAKVSPTIIFIDEVDSMLGKRMQTEHDSRRALKNEFMSHWDGLLTKPGERILVLAATNRPFDLDDAIIRRFQRRIMVGLPSVENRERILKTLLVKENVEDLNFKELAVMTDGYSGSDLKNLCVTAAYRPVRELMQQEKQKAMDKKGSEEHSDKTENSSSVIKPRHLNMEDMKEAANKVAASFADGGSGMDELKQWNALYGDGGSRKKAAEEAPDNKFEKLIRSEVIPPNEIGVTFEDIGALDETKESLKEIVMLPLTRPDIFNGGLLKPCRGILLFGPPGTGKTMIAKAIANEAGASFINVSMSTITSKWLGETEKNVRALFTLAAKVSPTILFVDEVDSMLGKRKENDHEARRALKNEFMSHWDGLLTKPGERILVLAATNRPFDLDDAIIRRFERRIMVGLPSVENRERILKTLLVKENVEDLNFKELAVMTDGYSGSDLKNLCVTAAYRPVRELMQQEKQKAMDKKGSEEHSDKKENSSSVIKPRHLNMKDMKEAANKVAASFAGGGSGMGELKQWNKLYGEGGSRKKEAEEAPDNQFEKLIRSQVIPPNEIGVTFEDIGELDETKESLKEIVMLPLTRPDIFNGRLLKPCRGILLFGPPGTGKTMLAKAIANEAGASFINVTLSTITSKWLGETEKNVRALFKLAAKVSPTIIFIDEVDSMLGKRMQTEHDSRRALKNEFMSHWDGLETKPGERILVLAATNRPFDLDDAIIRRFERRIMVGLPSVENREKILKTLLAKENVEDLDFKELAVMTDGYSGSDLKNLCVTASYRPVRELMQQEKQKPIDKKGSEENSDKKENSTSVIKPRHLNMEDMKEAATKVAASFAGGGSVMGELKQWNGLYGEGGSRKKEQLSYFI